MPGQLVNNQVVPPQWNFLFSPVFTNEDWFEAVSLYSPTQFSLGRKRSNATLTGYVPFAKLKACCIWLLGYSWMDTSRYLRRMPPAVHPIWGNLAATEITEAIGVKFVSKAASIYSPNALDYATYSMAKVTVAYSQPNFDILNDSDERLFQGDRVNYPGKEVLRWTTINPKPYMEMLDVPYGGLKFDAPGSGVPGLDKSPMFVGPKYLVRAEKLARKVTWLNVPLEMFEDSSGGWPKIDAAIGKCNSDTFFGSDPYVWLLRDVDIVDSQVYADPIYSAIHAVVGEFERRVDVIFDFSRFDPPLGTTSTPSTPPKKGWKTVPAYDSLYYPVKTSIGGQDPIRDTNFNDLFTAWDF